MQIRGLDGMVDPTTGVMQPSMAFGISSTGRVAGTTLVDPGPSMFPGPSFLEAGVRWKASAITDQLPTEIVSRLYRINERGDAVGMQNDFLTGLVAMLYRDGVLTELHSTMLQAGANGVNSVATDINESGLICCNMEFWLQPMVINARNLSVVDRIDRLRPADTVCTAEAINSRGDVVGRSGPTAFLKRQGHYFDLGRVERITDINRDGMACGAIFAGAQARPAICDTSGLAPGQVGTFTPLPLPSGFVGGYASAINSLGVVVGSCHRGPLAGTGNSSAFVNEGGKTIVLDTVLNNANWQLLHAYDINDHNEITGFGYYQGQVQGFVLSP